MNEDKESRERAGGCGSDCKADSKPHSTATLLSGVLSAVVKSRSEKCLLDKY
jgi:hypothetical protein